MDCQVHCRTVISLKRFKPIIFKLPNNYTLALFFQTTNVWQLWPSKSLWFNAANWAIWLGQWHSTKKAYQCIELTSKLSSRLTVTRSATNTLGVAFRFHQSSLCCKITASFPVCTWSCLLSSASRPPTT